MSFGPTPAPTQAARDYLDFVSDFLKIPVVLVGVGPGRDQVIWTGRGSAVAPATEPAPAV